jgi:uncharacterized protein
MTQNPNSFHMRRKDLEINDPVKIEKIIQEAKICHLALVDNDAPYVVPMNFGWEKGYLYLHSANHGRKIEILKNNNLVSFSIVGKMEVTDKSSCKIAYRSVSGSGRAHIVTTVEEKVLGIRAVMRQILGEEFEFPLKSLDRTTVFRIEILEIKGKQAGKF